MIPSNEIETHTSSSQGQQQDLQGAILCTYIFLHIFKGILHKYQDFKLYSLGYACVSLYSSAVCSYAKIADLKLGGGRG
jgi:hypothetical protein